jgi:CRP-like cAMP-binding protein
MLQQLKSQFDKEKQSASKGQSKYARSESERQEAEAGMVVSAAASMKLDRVAFLKKALHADSKTRSEPQNDAIMKFLQQESSFKTYFPEGSLFSRKDMETVRDGCKLRHALRNDALAQSGEYIDDIFVIVAGYICLESNETGVVNYRQAGDIIGVDALEKGSLTRKNNVIAATDVIVCSIDMAILLKSVGVRIGSDTIIDPSEFITKFWLSTKLWQYATSGSTVEPLFEFLCPNIAKKSLSRLDELFASKLKLSSEGETSSSSLSSSSDEEIVAGKSKGKTSKLSSNELELAEELQYVMRFLFEGYMLYIPNYSFLLYRKLVSHARMRTYRWGDNVFSQYDHRHYLFIIARGECAYCRHLPQTERDAAELESAPHEIDYGLHLFSQDFSFMDSEDTDEWIERKTSEMTKSSSIHSKDKFKRQHPFEQHKNTLMALTSTQVCVIPLLDVASSMLIFRKLFELSSSKYPLTRISNKDILSNYAKSLSWKKEQKEVVVVAVKQSYQKKIKDSSVASSAEAKPTV